MSYKSFDANIAWHNSVIKEFVKGVRLYKAPGDVISREKLSSGSTKYNIEILRELKDIQKDYLHTIAIESTIIHFVEKYMDKHPVMTRNVWGLMIAQKKTANFIDVFINALKQYAVKDKDIYACINKWIESLQERVVRNLKFTEEHMVQFGLLPLVDVIKEKYGITIYEYIDQLSSEHFSKTGLKKSDEGFYMKRDLFIYESFASLAEEYGINIAALIEGAECSALDRAEEKRQKAAASKRAQNKMEEQKLAYQLNAEDNTQLYHSIENADDRIGECRHLIKALEAAGGEVWYLTSVKKAELRYITSGRKRTLCIDRAALFPSKDSEELKNLMAAYSEEHPKDIVSVQYLNLPKNLPGYEKALADIKVIDPIKIELGEQEHGLYMTLTDTWDISQIQCCSLEFELMRHDGNIYGICMVKENQYTVESCWISEDWQKNGEIEKPAFITSASKIRWHHTEEEAQKVISEIKDIMPANMSAHVVHLEYHGPYNLHDYIMDKCINKTIGCITQAIKREDKAEICAYFGRFSDFMCFTDALHAAPVYTIVSEECTGRYSMKYLTNSRIYGSLNDMMQPCIKNPILVHLYDKEGMEKLKKLCRQLHMECGKRWVYCIVKFWEKDGKYGADVVYKPWEDYQVTKWTDREEIKTYDYGSFLP